MKQDVSTYSVVSLLDTDDRTWQRWLCQTPHVTPAQYSRSTLERCKYTQGYSCYSGERVSHASCQVLPPRCKIGLIEHRHKILKYYTLPTQPGQDYSQRRTKHVNLQAIKGWFSDKNACLTRATRWWWKMLRWRIHIEQPIKLTHNDIQKTAPNGSITPRSLGTTRATNDYFIFNFQLTQLIRTSHLKRTAITLTAWTSKSPWLAKPRSCA